MEDRQGRWAQLRLIQEEEGSARRDKRGSK